jgi:hypothetical protein
MGGSELLLLARRGRLRAVSLSISGRCQLGDRSLTRAMQTSVINDVRNVLNIVCAKVLFSWLLVVPTRDEGE